MTVKRKYLSSIWERVANDDHSLITSPTQWRGISDAPMADAVNWRSEAALTSTCPPVFTGMELLIPTAVDPEIGPATGHAITIRRIKWKVKDINYLAVSVLLRF
jgi:hypothetical protein